MLDGSILTLVPAFHPQVIKCRETASPERPRIHLVHRAHRYTGHLCHPLSHHNRGLFLLLEVKSSQVQYFTPRLLVLMVNRLTTLSSK
jgi:hypothetical protein